MKSKTMYDDETSCSLMSILRNISGRKEPKFLLQLLALLVYVLVPVLMQAIFKEIDPAILFGSMFGAIFISIPNKHNEPYFRDSLIKYLSKGKLR